MKLGILITTLCIGAHAVADPAITDVTAKQRYPWNGKVDISYKVSGIEAAAKQKGWITSLKVTAKDQDTGTTYTATSLTGDTSFADGTHALVWDMAAHGLAFKSTNVTFNVTCVTKDALYCVIDLSGGPTATSYPVSYMGEIPSGSWSDQYKTTKIPLRRIKAGTYKMQGVGTVTLTKDFYLGVYEMTQRQWELVTGSRPVYSYQSGYGDSKPVFGITYNSMRGKALGSKWPTGTSVDESSMIGKIQKRTGLKLDLPTDAQWEYACRAGTTTSYYWGNDFDGNYEWYSGNSDSEPHIVGTRAPNPWDLYDMSGNVAEACLDWFGTLTYGDDPMGATSGSGRVMRGGAYSYGSSSCTSSQRSSLSPDSCWSTGGLRLSMTIQ